MEGEININMKIKKIFTLEKALKLKKLGNEILFTEPNYKYKNLRVFCFEDTIKLRHDWLKINK